MGLFMDKKFSYISEIVKHNLCVFIIYSKKNPKTKNEKTLYRSYLPYDIFTPV